MKYKFVIEGYMNVDIDPEQLDDQTIEGHIEGTFYYDPIMFFDMADEDISVNVEKID